MSTPEALRQNSKDLVGWNEYVFKIQREKGCSSLRMMCPCLLLLFLQLRWERLANYTLSRGFLSYTPTCFPLIPLFPVLLELHFTLKRKIALVLNSK